MSYEADDQDAIIGEALAAGGRAFVSELHAQAADRAAQAIGWDQTGPEPAGYRSVWLIVARQILTERVRSASPHDPSAGHHTEVPDVLPGALTLVTGYRMMADGLDGAVDELDENDLRDYVRGLAHHLRGLATWAETQDLR